MGDRSSLDSIVPQEIQVPEAPAVAIVDDDESIRVTTKDLLESAGFSAPAFASAESLLKSGLLNRFSCVIADVRMPGMTGVELHQRLLASNCAMPMILMTAYPEERVRAATTKTTNIVAYLVKPFEAAELLTCVGQAIKMGDANSG